MRQGHLAPGLLGHSLTAFWHAHQQLQLLKECKTHPSLGSFAISICLPVCNPAFHLALVKLVACFLGSGWMFSSLPVTAHKGAALAGSEIRTGQSGVTAVHLTLSKRMGSTFDLASPEVAASGNLLIPFFLSTVNLISAHRNCLSRGKENNSACWQNMIWLL